MNYTVHKWLLLCSTLAHTMAPAISIVYNFRIGQATKQPISGESRKKHSVVTLVFNQYQKKYNEISQNFAGGFASFIYTFDAYYFRTDVSAAHIHSANAQHKTTLSATQTDDILFTLGRNFKIKDKAILTASGLFGVPTHKINSLQHVDFGYGQVGTGIQLDGSYALNQKSSFLYGARSIHFFARSAKDTLCQNYRFTIGNVGDLLAAYKYNRTKHGLETGYTMRSQFDAAICPTLADVVKKTNYLRSSFYFIYKYKFAINNTENRLLFNISYGFDHKPKFYGNKYIITLWGSWNISF